MKTHQDNRRTLRNVLLGMALALPAFAGIASGKDPAKVEQQLRAILPPEESSDFCHRLVLHGRAVCAARKPACDRCCLAPYCKSFTGE